MDIIIITIWIGLYVAQLSIVLSEMSKGHYSRRLNFIKDLIPLFFMLEGCLGLFKIVFEIITKNQVVENFKKLKW